MNNSTRPHHFSIPFGTLKMDIPALFAYELSQDNCDALDMENVSVKELNMEVSITKKVNFFLLHFSLYGSIQSSCDRCTSDIAIPILDEANIIVKMVNNPIEYNANETDPDMYYIGFNEQELNVKEWVDDLLYLGIPSIKKCTEEGKGDFCNQDILRKFLV